MFLSAWFHFVVVGHWSWAIKYWDRWGAISVPGWYHADGTMHAGSKRRSIFTRHDRSATKLTSLQFKLDQRKTLGTNPTRQSGSYGQHNELTFSTETDDLNRLFANIEGNIVV